MTRRRQVMISAKRTYALLENQSLWDAARQCHALLAKADIPHAVMGGVAVCLHGYQRNTVDVDLLIRKEDTAGVRRALEKGGFTWDETKAEFRTPSGIPIQFLHAGDKAGPASEVVLPDPGDEATCITLESLPVLSLARLIESKIACGEASPRRFHKDLADVVELIARHDLTATFARFLHKSLRPTFRALVRSARGK